MTDLNEIKQEIEKLIADLKLPLIVKGDQVWLKLNGDIGIQLEWHFNGQKYGIGRIHTWAELNMAPQSLRFNLLMRNLIDWFEQNTFYREYDRSSPIH